MTSILAALRKIAIPDTSKQAYRAAITLIVAAGSLEVILRLTAMESPLFGLAVNLSALGFAVALWYLVLGWLRSRQEHAEDLNEVLSLTYSPQANNYTSLKYDSLGYSSRHMPPYIPLLAGVTVLVMFGFVWLVVLFADLEEGTQSGQLLPEAGAISAVFTIAGAALVAIGIRMVRRDSKLKPTEEKYRLFLADNNFTHKSAGRGEALGYALDQMQLGEVPADERVATSIMSGIYQGKGFELLGLRAKKGRDKLYFGLVRRLCGTTYQSALTDSIRQLDDSGEVLDVVFDNGYVNVVLAHHPPRDRVGMVRLFRYIDAVDTAEAYNSSTEVSNGQ